MDKELKKEKKRLRAELDFYLDIIKRLHGERRMCSASMMKKLTVSLRG